MARRKKEGPAWGSPKSPQGYATPRTLAAELARRYTRGGWTLDAAAAESTAVCAWFFDGADHGDGLALPWCAFGGERGRVFCNPPWNNIGPWIKKGLREIREERAEVVVFLVPARTSAGWWALTQEPECQVEGIRGRVNYLNPETMDPVSGCAEHSCAVVMRPPLRAADWRR